MSERVSKYVSIAEHATRTHITIRARPVWLMAALSLVMLWGLGGFLWMSGRWLTDDLVHRADNLNVSFSLALVAVGAVGACYAARLGWRALLSREVLTLDSVTLSLRRGAVVGQFESPRG